MAIVVCTININLAVESGRGNAREDLQDPSQFHGHFYCPKGGCNMKAIEEKKKTVEVDALKTTFEEMEDALGRASDIFRAAMAMMGLVILALRENEEMRNDYPGIDSLDIAKDALSEKFHTDMITVCRLMNKLTGRGQRSSGASITT